MYILNTTLYALHLTLCYKDDDVGCEGSWSDAGWCQQLVVHHVTNVATADEPCALCVKFHHSLSSRLSSIVRRSQAASQQDHLLPDTGLRYLVVMFDRRYCCQFYHQFFVLILLFCKFKVQLQLTTSFSRYNSRIRVFSLFKKKQYYLHKTVIFKKLYSNMFIHYKHFV